MFSLCVRVLFFVALILAILRPSSSTCSCGESPLRNAGSARAGSAGIGASGCCTAVSAAGAPSEAGPKPSASSAPNASASSVGSSMFGTIGSLPSRTLSGDTFSCVPVSSSSAGVAFSCISFDHVGAGIERSFLATTPCSSATGVIVRPSACASSLALVAAQDATPSSTSITSPRATRSPANSNHFWVSSLSPVFLSTLPATSFTALFRVS